ncbi:hypothetical protein [Paenibacillus algicola]|uniref:hypothetical protein n=1 Tax=Paenibacillus algicola TaxID=2565926 RepID=UPI0010FE09F7|nr:hypothetical protein [Paenibacillus algicola]
MNGIHPKAMHMIHNALGRLIDQGRNIERISMVVCTEAPISVEKEIQTQYGMLKIQPDGFVPRGVSYLIEDPGRRNRGFAWVSSSTIAKKGGA